MTLADRDRRGVGRRIAHAATHVRIERQPQCAQQHLALARLADRHLFQAKTIETRPHPGTRSQHDSPVGPTLV